MCTSRVDERVVVRRSAYLVLKFVVEWLLSLLMLVILSPVLLLLGALVRATSRGPALYAQTRLGLGGRRYRIYKLRTMVHDAESATGPVWASLSGDARVTPLGRVLRSTHLDELPQLWNVLRGEMGLIGPRPERPEIAGRIERKVPGYGGRLAVRPGVTGLAQMLLPADDPSDPTLSGVGRKLAMDLYYVSHAGAGLDLRIAAATPCYFLAEAARAAGEASAKGLAALRKRLLRPHAVAVPISTVGTAVHNAVGATAEWKSIEWSAA
jgi:lipopolysaccharide/colanic/teichoic acid biosynthesis glycosyltransferase